MERLNDILVVFEAGTKQQPAVLRALFVAEKFNSRITVLGHAYHPSVEQTDVYSSADVHEIQTIIEEGIEQQITSFLETIDASVKIDFVVRWSSTVHQAVLDELTAADYQLVVRQRKAKQNLAALLFTPSDWKILRHSPVDVLMVNDHVWYEQAKVLAAVSLDSINPQNYSLCSEVINVAHQLANVTDSAVVVANAYPSPPVGITMDVNLIDTADYHESAVKQRKEKIKSLADEVDVAEYDVVIREGLPEDVLPEIASDTDCNLVVMGSVGRTGIKAALLGNTAEHILDALNCDVWVVKE